MTARLSARFAACLLAGALPLTSQAAFAQDEQQGSHRRDSGHGEAAEDQIVVVGHLPSDFGLLASTATLEGDKMVMLTRGQIGESLTRLPGVSATSFAPGASRPVLRGFDGDRIRVLTDGIGAIDASSVSADHAVVFDPLTVDHIDIVHGPAVLLFGGQAIGGAVNAIDKRIPRKIPDRIAVTAIAGYGSASDERSAGAAIDAPLGGNFVVHVDANWRKSNDLKVGGLVNSEPLRQELLQEAAFHRSEGEAEEADEFEGLANLSERIPNSAARSYTLGAGAAYIAADGSLGLSVQHYDSQYGVPLRPGSGHGPGDEEGAGESEHGAGTVAIDLQQTRVDLRGELKLHGLFESVQLRGAYGDYKHVELEGGEAGTRFSGNGVELRADLIQAERSGWRGRSGFQFQTRNLKIQGAEAFTPDNSVDRWGLFTLQSQRFGLFEIEAAGRYEKVTVKSEPTGFHRGFDLWSGALGLSYAPAKGLKIGANYIRGARAPAPEELLSNGLHVATQSFEVGNPAFRTETSDGFEAYLHYKSERASFSITGYVTRFGNFIAALPSGEDAEGFPVFRYAQLPARFHGFEASASVEAWRWGGGSLTLDASADYTHARLVGVGPAPRIPPLRLRGGAEVQQGPLRLRGEVEWNDGQNRVAAFENPVPAFTLVNLSADWHPMGEDGPLTLILSADNLFDVVGRRAASFTRDFVPIAGRDVRITARIAF